MADYFEVTVDNTLHREEITRAYQLYKNVSDKNYALNNIEFPYALFEAMNQSDRWEFIQLRLKPAYVAADDNPLVGVVCNYRTEESYCAVALGMDYTYAESFKIYKQVLFQIAMRGQALGKQRVLSGNDRGSGEKKVRRGCQGACGLRAGSG